ncbi:MAG: membrane dipeptidase [Tissierellia bacterium]|nr:membrane dipeptidase [Tissierellia bacterium]
MKYIDMHVDTLMRTSIAKGENPLYINDIASVDFKRLKAGNCIAQFFAIFLLNDKIYKMLGREPISDDAYIDELLAHFHEQVTKYNDIIEVAYNIKDLEKNESEGKISAFLTIEDGKSLNDDLSKLDLYYEKGIRLISLLWNFENCIGFPNSTDKEIMAKGLKPFGFEVVEKMNDLGMIIDVSHLSDGGFYDVAKASKKPFVASHSNARILSPHQRNLKDDMIKIIADSGGAIGLNFGPEFLNKDITNKDSTIDLMVDHLNHIKNIGGEDVVAIGSDFDGIGGNLEIDSADKMPNLFERLSKEGWSEEQIEKLAWKNIKRVIKDTMK